MKNCLSRYLAFMIWAVMPFVLHSCTRKTSSPPPPSTSISITDELVGSYLITDTFIRTWENDTTEYTTQSYLGTITKVSNTQINLKNFIKDACSDSFTANVTDTSILPISGCHWITTISRAGTVIRFTHNYFQPQGSHAGSYVRGVAMKQP